MLVSFAIITQPIYVKTYDHLSKSIRSNVAQFRAFPWHGGFRKSQVGVNENCEKIYLDLGKDD